MVCSGELRTPPLALAAGTFSSLFKNFVPVRTPFQGFPVNSVFFQMTWGFEGGEGKLGGTFPHRRLAVLSWGHSVD